MTESLVRDDESLAQLFDRKIALIQARRGHRTAVDALALAWCAAHAYGLAGGQPSRLVDLGAGSGIVALLLGAFWPQVALTLVELQPQQADRARRNLLLNAMADRAEVLAHDLAEALPSTLPPCDLVVSNPPYRQAGPDQPPVNRERRLAHFETSAGLGLWMRRVAQLLVPTGLAVVVYPWKDRERLAMAAAAAGLADQQLVPMRHRPSDAVPTRAILVAGQPLGRAGLIKMSGLTLHPEVGPDSTYSLDITKFIGDLRPAHLTTLPPLPR